MNLPSTFEFKFYDQKTVEQTHKPRKNNIYKRPFSITRSNF